LQSEHQLLLSYKFYYFDDVCKLFRLIREWLSNKDLDYEQGDVIDVLINADIALLPIRAASIQSFDC
jgi:hypothetical protein